MSDDYQVPDGGEQQQALESWLRYQEQQEQEA
jgi:hypothetical protein